MSKDNSIEQARNRFETELQRYLTAIRAANRQQITGGIAPPVPAHKLTRELDELGQWLRTRFNEFMKLLEISSELNKVLLLDDILGRIYTFFQDVIPYDRIGCALISDDGAYVTAYWARFTYERTPSIGKGYTAPLRGSSLESIIRTGEPRILNDLEQYLSEHPDSESTRRIVAEGIRSSLTCPLVAEGKPVGFLFFSSRQKNTYQHLHQEIFRYIAGQVAQIIEKSRLYQQIMELNQELQDAYEQLKEQASRDALTGLLNRGAILEYLNQQLQQARAAGHHLAVIMLDIDHFKKVNDTFGHVNGDIVLRHVANILQHQLTATGRAGRYGGEEFLVVLTGQAADMAEESAEQARAAIAAQEIPLDDDVIRATASFGVSSLREQPGFTLTELIELADSRLYEAKAAGRNRVCGLPVGTD